MNFTIKLNDIIVWIPSQSASVRVPEKNIKPFYKGKSLLEIKISQLTVCGVKPKNIYISSESFKVKEICKKFNTNFILRTDELLGNNINQEDLFNHFLENTPDFKNQIVAWVQVTDPLFSDFSVFDKIEVQEKEVIVLSQKINKHAFYKNDPVNFVFGKFHKVTQEIEPIIIPRWSVFIALRRTFDFTKYHFGIINKFISVDDDFIDIDTKKDFEKASKMYSKINEKS